MIRTLLAAAALVAAVLTFARVQSLAVDAPSGQPAGAVTVPIQAQSNSGQVGVATLTSTSDNQTQVVIQLTGAAADSQEPAHIHVGTCAKLDPKPTYPLTTVAGGKSTTTVAVPLKSLMTGGYAINVHQSTANIGTYVACGNIPAAGQMAATPEPAST